MAALSVGVTAPDFTLNSTPDLLGPRMRFVFRNFPLTKIHPNAELAAEAAGAQRRSWEMHDALYARN